MAHVSDKIMSKKASEDISMGYAVVLGSTRGEVSLPSGANAGCFGVMDSDALAGGSAAVVVSGLVLAVAAAAISIDDMVTVDADGKFIKIAASAATYNVMGRCTRAAAADGDYFEFLIEKRSVVVAA